MNGHCVECGKEYQSVWVEDGLCASCHTLEPRNDPQPSDDDGPRWRWSKAAMRERLGVSGDRDE